jgi:predicted DNA-binding transcriptional regulator AlpA
LEWNEAGLTWESARKCLRYFIGTGVMSELISMMEAAKLAGGLHPNTFRQRKAGTEHFTHVEIGRRVMLVRSEVEEWLAKKIAQGKANQRQQTKTLQLVRNRL